jgi:hypothetical protein
MGNVQKNAHPFVPHEKNAELNGLGLLGCLRRIYILRSRKRHLCERLSTVTARDVRSRTSKRIGVFFILENDETWIV